MNRFIPLILFLFASPAIPHAAPDRQTVESSVEQATVFQNSAQITRTATVHLASGRNEITFEGLTPSLKPETIQLRGSDPFMIMSLSHRREYIGVHPQKDRLERLKAQRDSLERIIEDKESTQSVLERERNILLSNINLKGDQQNLTAAELEKAMEYFHRKLTDLENGQLTLTRELDTLNEELEKIEKQISELDDDAERNRSLVTAVLQSDQSEQVELRLTYLVADAGWYPSYDLRVADVDGPVNLSYKANIRQSTGIDWNQVDVTVSSAIPDRGGGLPDLRPWYIRFRDVQPQKMKEGRAMKVQAPAADQRDQAEDRMEAARRTVTVQEVQNQTSFSYRIDIPYDVPSGGKPLTVAVKNNDIPAEYRYYTVPKRRSEAYLTARISEWDQYNILPGEANLFFGETYVGKSSIDPRSVGDTLSFSLGSDESVVVEREKLREFKEKNFFGNKVRESFAREISVRNSKDQPISIEVLDQVPVSENEDINVSLQESSGAHYNRQTGMLTWQLQLGAGETRELRFVYEVEYPEGKPIDL